MTQNYMKKTRKMNSTEILNVLKYHKETNTCFFDGRKGLFLKGDIPQLVSNSLFVPLNVYKNIYIYQSRKEISIELAIIVANECDENRKGFLTEILFDEIEKFDFQKNVDTEICTTYNVEKANKLIAKLIRQQIVKCSCKERFCIDKLGWQNINGKRIYCAGNTVIGDASNLDINCLDELMQYKFEVKSFENDECAKTNIKEYLNLYLGLYEEKSALVFAYFILALLKELFEEASIPIRFSMFLTGENQSYKTTIASYGTALYYRLTNVEEKIHNLSGSEAQLHRVLDVEKDMVSLIDDLNLSDSKIIMREQEKKISSIIFSAANNVGRETMKYRYSINSLVMFCGEYCLTNTSTNNRLVVIKLEKDGVNKTELTKFEKKAGNLSLFTQWFIEWCSVKYDSIVWHLKEMFQEYRNVGDAEEVYQERLKDHYKLLSMSYSIFMQFCDEKGLAIKLSQEKFDSFLENAMYEQIELLRLDNIEENDYVKEVFEYLRNDWDFYVFEQQGKRNEYWRKDIYYDQDQEMIYIPGNILSQLVSGSNENAISPYKVASQFEKLDLLCMDKNKNHSRTKKIKGKRVYCIDYCKWEAYIKETYAK